MMRAAPFALLLSFVLWETKAASFTTNDLPPMQELPEGGKLWALLVAGSEYFSNYRHQADVCHAYQIVHSHGIPDENIIVMMADDIAHNPQNKFPGTVINKPNGSDVYHGVPHDYTGEANNPVNFLHILKGVPSAEHKVGKVIDSGPNDHVFVYFADHGAPGLLAFPQDVLKANDLMAALKRKWAKKGYSKLVFYVEACESGSMFEGLLPEDINVYATTAANATTSSYACYFDRDLQTYLGDVYSIKWLEDSDVENLNKETLETQFDIVKAETSTSQVCEFGDLSMGKLPVAEFQGARKVPSKKYSSKPKTSDDPCIEDAVPSGEVPRILLEKKVLAAQTPEELLEAETKLNDYLSYTKSIHNKMHRIIDAVTLDEHQTMHILSSGTPKISKHDCYYAAIDAFHESCYNLGQHEYALRLMYGLANLCESNYNADHVVAAIEDICRPIPNIEVH